MLVAHGCGAALLDSSSGCEILRDGAPAASQGFTCLIIRGRIMRCLVT